MMSDLATPTYSYQVRSKLNIDRSATLTRISGIGSRVKGFTRQPGTFGTTFATWIVERREAGLWRWSMQVTLSIFELAVTAPSVTGSLIWGRK